MNTGFLQHVLVHLGRISCLSDSRANDMDEKRHFSFKKGTLSYNCKSWSRGGGHRASPVSNFLRHCIPYILYLHKIIKHRRAMGTNCLSARIIIPYNYLHPGMGLELNICPFTSIYVLIPPTKEKGSLQYDQCSF